VANYFRSEAEKKIFFFLFVTSLEFSSWYATPLPGQVGKKYPCTLSVKED